MRVVVVGTGFGARVVAPAFAATPGCEVVEVVSARDDAAVRAAISRHDVDLVSVHSPPFLHAEHVARALDAQRAVLCDKPFGRSAGDAEAMLEQAVGAGVLHVCNFELRFLPARRALRALLDDGLLGRVEHVSWSHVSAGSRVPLRPYGWLFDAGSGGGWVGAWASHAVDALRDLLGDAGEVTWVEGIRRRAVRERPDRAGVAREVTAEDGLSAMLVLAGGATASLDSTFAAPSNLTPRLTLVGTDAIAQCIGDARVVVDRAGERDEISLPVDASGADHHEGPMRTFAAVVRDAFEAGAAPAGVPTFVDGLACARTLDALRRLPLVG